MINFKFIVGVVIINIEEKRNRKIALITGASGEIGSAIAILLAKNNIDLILHYNSNYKDLSKIEEECKKFDINTHVVQADFNNMESINNLFNEIKLNNLSPDILINTVGIASYGLIQDINYEEWQKVVNVNLMSTFFCAQNVVKEMIRQKYGRIINISSVWGEKGAANEVAYSLTKGAVNTFTKALALELAPSGITVNAIAPGVVDSKMMSKFTNEELDIIKNEIPMNRFVNSDEIAQSVLYFLHPKSSNITGQILKIDGGWS